MSVFLARTRAVYPSLFALAILVSVALATNSAAGPNGTLDPNLVADPPTNPRLENYTSGGQTRLLLRFDGYIHNAGPGAFEIRGSNRSGAVMQTVEQRFYNGSTFADVPSGSSVIYETADGHNHFHWMRAGRYSLWNSAKTAEVAPAQKVGFCLEDSQRIETNGPSSGLYQAVCQRDNPTASSVAMGVSAGWRDLYQSTLAFQWVDISDVRPGTYWLRSEIDPENLITESDEVNPPAFAAASSTVPGYVATPVTAGTLPLGLPSVVPLQATQFGSPGARQFRIESAPACGVLSKALGTWFPETSVTYTPGPTCTGPQSFDFSARSSTSQFPLNPVKASATFTVDGTTPPPPRQPTIQWSNPTSGATVSGNYAVDGGASNVTVGLDGGTLQKVEFRVDGTLKNTDTSNPLELAWDTTTVANGNHTLNAKVFLTSGETAEQTITVNVQNAAQPPPPRQPSVTWLSPLNGATVSGSYAQDGGASNVSVGLDGGTLQKVEFRVDNVLKSTDTSAPLELAWDSTTVTNGNHTLNAKVFLTSGETAEQTVTVNVQNAAPPPNTPSITWLNPTNGATISGNYNLDYAQPGDVSVNLAGRTFDRIEFSVDGVYKNTERNPPWELVWDSRTVSDGPHTLTAKLFMTNGTTATQNISVNVLNNAPPPPRQPTIQWSNPTSGATVSGNYAVDGGASNVTVGLDGGTLQKVEFRVDGTLKNTDTSNPLELAWDTTTVANGNHTLNAKVFLTSGETAEQTITVNVQNAAQPPPPRQPSVTWLSPLNGATVSGSYAQDGGASNVSVGLDGGTLQKVEFRVDNVLKSTDTSAPLELAWDSTTVTNGNHTLNAKVFLTSGETAEQTVTVNVQNAAPPPPPPQPSITWLSPLNGATVSGVYAEDGGASNVSPNLDGGTLQKIEFRVDGVLKSTELSAPWELNWDTRTVANGNHTLNAKLYLVTGQTAEQTITVNVQNAAPPPPNTPSITWLNPTNGATISGTYDLDYAQPGDVSVVLAGRTFDRIEFAVDGVYKNTERNPPWELVWNSRTVANGNHTLRARLFMTNGTTATSNITVNVQNSGASSRSTQRSSRAVAISGAPSQLYPGTGAQLTAAVTNGSGVAWRVNGVPGGNSAVGTISSNGLYRAPARVPSPATVKVRATHASGASDEESIRIVRVPAARPAIGPSHSYAARGRGRGLSKTLGLMRQGRYVFARVLAERSGRVWVGLRRNGRTVARCKSTVVAGRRGYACRMKLARGQSMKGLRVVVTLRRRGKLVATRTAAVPAEHHHDH